MEIPILLSGPLTFRAAGLARSVLDRVAALVENGHQPVLLIDTEQANLEHEITELVAAGRLSDSVRVFAMLDDFAECSREGSLRKEPLRLETVFDTEGLRQVVSDDVDNRRYYLDSEYVGFEHAPNGSAVFLDVLANGRRRKRLCLRPNGTVWKIQTFDEENTLVLDEYVNNHSVAYLQVSYADGHPKSWTFLDSRLRRVVFTTFSELVAYWLINFHATLLRDRALIVEWTFRDAALARVKHELGTKVISTFHNSHLGAPHRYGSSPKRELEGTLSRLAAYDAIVVLTEEQRLDLLKDNPALDNVYVIPHVILQRPRAPLPERDPNLVVYIGRLAPEKGLGKLLDGMPRIIKLWPDLRLEIYGRGPEETRLAQQIELLGLSDNVRLMGFTDHPMDVYASAAVGLFPSQYEGQSLSVGECLAAGCTPVGYDFKYGMRHWVSHGANGLICDMNNVDEVLDSVLLLLSRPELRERMSETAIAEFDAAKDSELLSNRWVSLLASLTKAVVAEGREP